MGVIKTIFGRRESQGRPKTILANGLTMPLEDKSAQDALQQLKEIMLKDKEAAYAKLKESPESCTIAEYLLSDEVVRSEAAKVLVRLYVENGDGKRIDALLTHDYTVIRAAASWHLSEVSEKLDMEFALPAMGNALADSNTDVQQCITRALLNAASNEKTREKAISMLASALSHGEESVRYNAARTLADAAEKGIDTTSAIRVLAQSLPIMGEEARKEATRALLHASINDKTRDDAVSVLRNALSDKNDAVRLIVTHTLRDAADKGADISISIPALGNALYDKNTEIRIASSMALKIAAKNGFHIISAIPMLEHALSDNNEKVREAASKALGYAVENEKTSEMAIDYLKNALSNKKRYARELAAAALKSTVRKEKTREIGISAFAKALQDGNSDVRLFAAQAFSDFAEEGIDITAAHGDLAHALVERRNRLVQIHSACALGFAALNGFDTAIAVEPLGKNLRSGDARVKLSSSWALAASAEKGICIETAIPCLFDAFGDKNPETRMNAAKAMVGALANERTRETTASRLGRKISDRNEKERVREMATWAVLNAVEGRLDVTPAIADLGNALIIGGEAVSLNAVLALLSAAEKGLGVSAAAGNLGKALIGKDREVALYSARTLLCAAEKGQDIKAAKERLAIAVLDHNPEIRSCAKKASALLEKMAA